MGCYTANKLLGTEIKSLGDFLVESTDREQRSTVKEKDNTKSRFGLGRPSARSAEIMEHRLDARYWLASVRRRDEAEMSGAGQ